MLRLTILSAFLANFILSCQVLGLQKIQEACNSPLGIQNGKVPDDHFSASSYSPYLYIGGGKHKDMKAKYCRLNHRYAWCANRRRVQAWFMVDLGQIMHVTAIATQGYAGVGDYFVTSFKLAYSSDKRSWKFAGKNKTVQEFVGNKHGVDIKNNTFDPIQARFIKVVPTNYQVRICLRIELYGCATKESLISTTAKPTTPRMISDSKLSTSSKSPTTMNTGLPSSQLIPLTTTKATSNKTPKMTSFSQTTTTNLTSKRKPTSSHVTGLPSHHSTTTEPSSPLAPTTSSSPVAMTTTQPREGTTLKDTLQRKSSNVEEEEKIKNYFIIAGLMGSLVLLGFAGFFILFIILRQRKRKRSWRCQSLDLPVYPYDNGVDSNGSIDNFLMIAQENNSALPMEM